MAVLPAAGLVHAEEWLEDALLILLRDAAAGVGDAEQELFQLLSDRNPYRAARPVVLDSILRQVEDQPVDQCIAAGHNAVTLYQAFRPEEARRIWKRIELHHTPKHGSWLDMAEIELSVFTSQCINSSL